MGGQNPNIFSLTTFSTSRAACPSKFEISGTGNYRTARHSFDHCGRPDAIATHGKEKHPEETTATTNREELRVWEARDKDNRQTRGHRKPVPAKQPDSTMWISSMSRSSGVIPSVATMPMADAERKPKNSGERVKMDRDRLIWSSPRCSPSHSRRYIRPMASRFRVLPDEADDQTHPVEGRAVATT